MGDRYDEARGVMATTDEAKHLEAALKAFGWECGPEFEKRYVTDPWVFNLANAVDNLTYQIEAIKATAREAMGECGTSSTTHHLLRKIVPDWREAINEVRPMLGDPLLMRSELTGNVYVVTAYKQHDGGLIEATTKYDVTDQFYKIMAGEHGE